MNCLKCKHVVFDSQDLKPVYKCRKSMNVPFKEPKLLLTLREARSERNKCGPAARDFESVN